MTIRPGGGEIRSGNRLGMAATNHAQVKNQPRDSFLGLLCETDTTANRERVKLRKGE
jgi:hypothetical protein